MVDSDAVVDLSKADTRFLRSLTRELGAADLSKCFQCGGCTAHAAPSGR